MKLTITSDSPIGRNRRASQAFTLVELMVSVSILVILMLVVANFVNLVQRTWVRTNSATRQPGDHLQRYLLPAAFGAPVLLWPYCRWFNCLVQHWQLGQLPWPQCVFSSTSRNHWTYPPGFWSD